MNKKKSKEIKRATKERRNINFDKVAFDRIKIYCDHHMLHLGKWATVTLLRAIEQSEQVNEEDLTN